MKLLKTIVLACTLFVIAGCESLPSGNPSAALSDPTKGIVMASVTAETGKHTHDAWFYIRKRGNTDYGQRLAASGFSPFGKDNDFPERSLRTGRLLAVPLEPGEYELFTWTLYIQTFGGYGYISPKTPPPPVTFSVFPRKVTYLGYLHIDTIMDKNIFGISIPAGGRPEIVDSFESDATLMRKKFPALATWPIQNAAPSGTAWKVQ